MMKINSKMVKSQAKQTTVRSTDRRRDQQIRFNNGNNQPFCSTVCCGAKFIGVGAKLWPATSAVVVIVNLLYHSNNYHVQSMIIKLNKWEHFKKRQKQNTKQNNTTQPNNKNKQKQLSHIKLKSVSLNA